MTEREDCKQLEEGHSANNNTQSQCIQWLIYLCHFLLGGKEVVIGQVHCVWT